MRGTNASLVLQAIATPNYCFGVFAGMYAGNLLSGKSHDKLNGLSAVLQNLAQVLEGVCSRLSSNRDSLGPAMTTFPEDPQNSKWSFHLWGYL